MVKSSFFIPGTARSISKESLFSTELTDGIAYFNGNFTFATLPQPTTITVSKMMPYASEYYLRRGKILTTINGPKYRLIIEFSPKFRDQRVNEKIIITMPQSDIHTFFAHMDGQSFFENGDVGQK